MDMTALNEAVKNITFGKSYIVKADGVNWSTRDESDEPNLYKTHKTFSDAHEYLVKQGYKKRNFDSNNGVTHYIKGEK